MAYGNISGSSIGSLLRQIQEQKSQSPIMPPSTDTASPIRGVVQEPLKAAEDVGTSKVVSLRPEGIAGNQPEKVPETLATPGPTVAQGAAMGQPGAIPIAPITPSTPSGVLPSTEPGKAAQRSSFGWSGIGGTRVYTPESGGETKVAAPSAEIKPEVSAPSIGTQITAKPTQKGERVINYSINQRANDEAQKFVDSLRAKGDLSTKESDARLSAEKEQIIKEASVAETDYEYWSQKGKQIQDKLGQVADEYAKLVNLADIARKEFGDAGRTPEYRQAAAEAEEKHKELKIMNEMYNSIKKKVDLAFEEKLRKEVSASPSPSPTPTPSPTPSNRQGVNIGQSISSGGLTQSQPRSSSGFSSGFSGGSVAAKSSGGGGGGGSWSAPAPQKSAAPKAPSIGTVLTGAIGQAWNKLFGRR